MQEQSTKDGLSPIAAEETVTPTPTPGVQRMSHKDHMTWMRDISMQIREHYQAKTGNKLSKPLSHALFTRDMGSWFSCRQKEQAEFADLAALDPQPFDPNAAEQEGSER
jgi:hypothetical protein